MVVLRPGSAIIAIRAVGCLHPILSGTRSRRGSTLVIPRYQELEKQLAKLEKKKESDQSKSKKFAAESDFY